MVKLGSVVQKIRSKNAGPFWVTIDIFCGSAAAYNQVVTHLTTDAVATQLQQRVDVLKRFDMAQLHVIKFSLPRPHVQGSRLDRDMHGAQWALLLDDIQLAD